jgi:hypothetical protein
MNVDSRAPGIRRDEILRSGAPRPRVLMSAFAHSSRLMRTTDPPGTPHE